MKDEIDDWLKLKDFYIGLELFDRYVKNRSLSRIFQIGGATSKNQQTLVYELNKLLKKCNQPPKIDVITPLPGKNDLVPVLENSCPSVALKDQQKNCYKILDHLHPLLSIGDKEARMKVAFEILETDDKLKSIDSKLRFFDEHGVVPQDPEPEKPKSINTEAELIRRQAALRVYVCRYEQKVLEEKSLKKIARSQELLAKYQMELDDVNRRLNR